MNDSTIANSTTPALSERSPATSQHRPAPQPDQPPRGTVAASPATRRTAIVVVSVIAAVAAYVSFRHQYGLAISAGEPAAMAWTLPVLIDGVIFMASLVMLDTSRRGERSPWLARLALAAGALATLAANVAEGWSGGWVSRLISAVAPVVLVVSYELLMGMLRRSPQALAEPEAEPVEVTGDRPGDQEEPQGDLPAPDVPATVEEAAALAYARSVFSHEPLSERKLADRFKLTRGAARNIIGEVVTKAVSSHLAGTGELPDADRIARLNGITVRRATEVLDAVAAEHAAASVEEADETGPAAEEKPPARWGDRVVPVPSQDADAPHSPEVRQHITRMRDEALMNYGTELSASNGQAGEGQ